MGTSAFTVVYDEGQEICVLRRHFDGYLDGHGVELAEFLSGIEIINGIQEKTNGVANGGQCLAAQIVAHFKDCVGNFYLAPAGTRASWCDYMYHVYANRVEIGESVKPLLVAFEGDREVFRGTASEFINWQKSPVSDD